MPHARHGLSGSNALIIWLSSYPRSGNTFLRTLLKGCCDYDTYSIYNDEEIGGDPGLTAVTGHRTLEYKLGSQKFDLTPQRSSDERYFIKTHEADRALVAEADKVIYIVRDGREATSSFHKYLQKFHNADVSPLGLGLGLDFPGVSWSEHVANWAPQSSSDTLLLYFEELTADPRAALDQVAEFSGVRPRRYDIPEFQQLHEINPDFFRSGARDSYRTEVSAEAQTLFWLSSYAEMRSCGYTENLPPYIADVSEEALVTTQKALRGAAAYARRKLERTRHDIERAGAKVLADRAALIDQKSSQVSVQQASIKTLESTISRHEEAARKQEREMAELRETVGELQTERERVAAQSRRLENQLQAQRDSLAMLTGSWSWRLTKPFRVAARLLRFGDIRDDGK